MDQEKKVFEEKNENIDDRSIDMLDLFILLAKHKKLIVGLPFIVAAVTAIISLTMPDIYKASTKILPPQQAQSSAGALLAQLGGVAGAAAGAAGVKGANDLYIGMLKSRSIANVLIDKYSLRKVYDFSSNEKTQKKLEDSTTISSGRDGLIMIEVEDVDRERAAKIANSYTDELVNLTKTIAITEAAQRRLFYEKQLEITKNNLASAEIEFKNGLNKGGVVSVDNDGKAVLETIGRIRAQISSKEVKISALGAFVTPNNQEFKREEEELKGLRAELLKLQNGDVKQGASNDNDGKNSGLDNIKILREVKYHQMMYELLSKQYELARLDEAKEPSAIQVLDIAVVPEKKIKPKRALIILICSVLAFFVAIGISLLIEAKRRAMVEPKLAYKLSELRSILSFRKNLFRVNNH